MAVEFEPLHDRLTVVPAGTFGGLSENMAKHQPLPRTIGRLIRFRFAAWVDPGCRLAVACDAPPLTARMLERVPVSVRSSRSLDLEWDRLRG